MFALCNNTMKKIEGFNYYCREGCEGRKFGQCMRCFNCGFLSKDGKGKCMKGNMYGPEDNKPEYNNARWIYNDPFWTNLFVSDSIMKPAPPLGYNSKYSRYP